jgi:hypothetical protein
MKRTLAVGILAVSLGCAHTHFERTGSNPPPPRPPGPCSALVFEEPPADRKFVEIGICMTSAPGSEPLAENSPSTIQDLKLCACQNGGNAILLKKDSEAGAVTKAGSKQAIRGRATVLLVYPKE